MKVKTSNLIGPALDLAVAKCRGFEGLDEDEWLIRDGIADMPLSAYNPSTDWAQAGPIIERHRIDLRFDRSGRSTHAWNASTLTRMAGGSDPLMAAMRAYVLSEVGDEVEVPNELFKG